MKVPVEEKEKEKKKNHSSVTDKEIFLKVLQQGWRNPGCNFTWATKFCMVAPKFVGPQYGTWLMSPF